MMNQKVEKGMSAKLAKRIEYSIIGLCLLALVFIFQPFSQSLFTLGSVLVVIGGLAFNLVPACVPGKPLKSVIKTGVIVIIVFVVVLVLALLFAQLYGMYFIK